MPVQNSFYPYLLKYRFSLLLSLITVLGLLLVFGFYFEEWQAFMNLTLYGDICTPPFHEVLFSESWFLQIPLLAYVSDYFNNTPVFGYWCLFIITLYVSLWLFLGFRILSRIIKRGWLLLIANYILITCIIGICLVNVNCTRDSILLTTASLLLYFDFYIFDNRKPKRYLFLFLLGCSMRVNPAVLSLSAMTLFSLVYFRDLKRTFHFLKFHWLFTAISFALVVVVNFNAHDLGPKVEDYEYPVLAKSAVVPLSHMKTSVDSMRYLALTQYFLVTDTAKITVPFIKRVVDHEKYRKLGVDDDDFESLKGALYPLLGQYSNFFLLGYLLLLIALANTGWKTLLNVLAINICCWMVVLVFAMKITMPERFLLPWFSMMLGMSFVLVSLRERPYRWWQKALLFFVGVSLVSWDMKMLKGFSNDGKEQKERSSAALKKIAALTQSKVPVIWDHHLGYIPNDVLARTEPKVLQKCIFQSIYRIQFYEFGQDRCLKKFGFSPLDFRSMGRVLNSKSDSVCFITEEPSAEFLRKYFETVYAMNFDLVKDEPVNEISPELFVYHLKREAQ